MCRRLAAPREKYVENSLKFHSQLILLLLDEKLRILVCLKVEERSKSETTEKKVSSNQPYVCILHFENNRIL